MVVFGCWGSTSLLEARYLAFKFLWLASVNWVQGSCIRHVLPSATEANYGEFFMAEAATAAKVTLQGDGSIILVVRMQCWQGAGTNSGIQHSVVAIMVLHYSVLFEIAFAFFLSFIHYIVCSFIYPVSYH